jgi:autotransporter-associated beta strand protein
MTTTTTNHRGLAAPAFSTHFSVGPMPATTTTSGDFSMQPSTVSASTTESPLASAAAPSLTGQALQCIGVISRSLVGIAIVVAILLVFVANASAQWSPGDAYNAVTLGSGEYFSRNSSYAQSFASRAASIETWVKFETGVDADMEIAEMFDTTFTEGASLYAEWNGSTGYTASMLGVGSFGVDVKTVNNATVMVPGQWYHVVGQYTSSSLNIYVDGTAATPVNWGGGQGPSGGSTFNRNTLGRAQNAGLATTFSGELTGFRIWDGGIGAPSEANSAVTANPNYAGVTLLANFQVGTDGVIPSTTIGNGSIDPITGSTGGTLDFTNAVNASVSKYGTGTIAVTTDSYFLDTIDTGTLDLGNGGTTGALTTDVVNNGTLAFNRSNALTHSNVISGTGAVTQSGSGTTTLTGANTYSGATTISSGTLRIGNGSTSGSISSTSGVANDGTLIYDRSDNLTESYAITGSGAVTQAGTGTLTLLGANTYTGDTTVESGILAITQDDVLNDASTLTLDSTSSLNLTHSGIDRVGALVIAGNPQLDGLYTFGTGQIQVGDVASPFQTWAADKGLTGAPGFEDGPADDPDQDGASNLAEFAFNGDPLSGADNGIIKSFITDSSDSGTDPELVLTIAVREGAPAFTGSPVATATHDGIVYSVEGSLNLVDFDSAVSPVDPITTGLPGSDYEYRSFRLDASDGLPSRGFLRAVAAPAP